MNAEQSSAGHEPAVTGAAAANGESARKKKPPRKRRRPALLYRFPKIFWRPAIDKDWDSDWRVVQDQDRKQYAALDKDLAVWDDLVKPRFRRLDHTAQILQNQFWRQNVMLIAGGLVATSLGAIQAALGGGVVGIAVVQAVLTGALAGLTVLIRSRRAQQGYLTARLKAERIKSEFFMFLARAGDYEGPSPRTTLLQQVEDIEAAEDMA